MVDNVNFDTTANAMILNINFFNSNIFECLGFFFLSLVFLKKYCEIWLQFKTTVSISIDFQPKVWNIKHFLRLTINKNYCTQVWLIVFLPWALRRWKEVHYPQRYSTAHGSFMIPVMKRLISSHGFAVHGQNQPYGQAHGGDDQPLWDGGSTSCTSDVRQRW